MTHLIESTLVLLLALAIAALPRLAARTRFAIVFAGLMKFALPSSWIGRLLPPQPSRSGSAFLTLIGRGASAMPAASPRPLMALWIAIGVALFLAMLLRARRTFAAALHGSTPATAAQLDLLEAAKRATGIRRPIALRVSQSSIAPAVAGVFRPVIIIPGSVALESDELASILAHECAHVARRDNLLGYIELIAGCALWFHPVVWLARRRLAQTREAACDEMAVARGDRNTYLSALAKICRAAAAPRIATISCIASKGIRERMNSIMRFGTVRTLPHRLVVAATIAVIAMLTIGAGVMYANAGSSSSSEKISMRLKDADLVDVIHSFEKLANVKINVEPNVHGKVTIEVHDTPWQDVLEGVVQRAGYTLTREGDHFVVR